MAKVAIGAGHGLYTAGKRTPDDEREWSFNDKVVKSAIKQLKADGHQVIRLDDPTGKTDVPLKERTNKANVWGADILISVHHNAYLGRWGTHTGTETFIYDYASSGSLKLAKAVQAKIVGAYGLYDRGVKRANFHMLRESEMPAILTEGGYMDSTIDVIKMRDELVLEHVGHAIADGVSGYFGVEKESKKEAPKTQVKSNTTKKSIDQLADEVIAGKHGSGEARKKALGSQYNAVQKRVNEKLGAKPKANKPKAKSISTMAQEVIDGKHGNGHENRRKSLGVSQSEYNKVRAEVNKRATGGSGKPSKSISQMATEVIRGDHGSGHANRRKSLGVSQSVYEKVRSEVNRRL